MTDKPSPITHAQCTHDQRRCWDTLAKVIHMDRQNVYPCGRGIRTSILGEAATHDSGLLTWLVLLAHRYCVRIAITSAGPRRISITAHPRDPSALSNADGHPSLDDLIRRAEATKPSDPPQ